MDDVAQLARTLSFVTVTPPGEDAVSRNAAVQGTNMVVAARRYLESWHRDLVGAVAALNRQIEDYVAADRQNTPKP